MVLDTNAGMRRHPRAAQIDFILAPLDQPEAHFYMNGGRGFGMTTTGQSSDAWREAFFNWLYANGLTRMPGVR